MRLDVPMSRGLSPRRIAVAGALGSLVLLAGCQPEQRPTAGSVKTIGSPTTKSVSGTTGSVSGVTAAAPKTGASPSPAASPSTAPTKGDGIYTPLGNVDIYQLLSLDVAEIATLTNAVNEGRPLPSAEILAIYENAKNAKVGTASRPLRAFATNANRPKDFPDEAAFFKSDTFLDDPVIAAINGTGPAAQLTPAQRRQVIQKGILRILRYYSVQEILAAEPKLQAGNIDPVSGAPHNVDEAWAIYVGVERDGRYPNALAAAAASREENYLRPGTVDRPLRDAFVRAQKAAAAGDQAAFAQAKADIIAGYNRLFYLSAARYLNEAVKAAQSAKPEGASTSLAEGFAYYQTIQPTVAKANAEADRTVTAFYQSDPAKLTVADRDRALAALNQAADALGLKSADRISPADYK